VLNRAFKIKDLGKARIIINIRVIRNRLKKTLTLNQTSYVHQILTKKGIKDYLPSDILIKTKLYVELVTAKNTQNANIEIY